jgi:hypothetical protein
MGWSDQGWAQVEEPEWEAPDPPVPPAGRSSRTAQLSILVLLVAALAAVACVAAGQLPRHHPLVPAFAFELPHLGAGDEDGSSSAAASIGRGRIVRLGGPPVAADPSTYTLHGRTAASGGVHSTGKVVLRGRWDDGPWLVLERTRTDAAGNFEVTSKLHRRGLLELRLMLPDGFIGTKTVRVE